MNKKSLLWSLVSLLVLTSLLLSACGAPATPTATEAPVVTEAPAVTQAPVATEAPTQVATGPSCGTDPVVLKASFETGFDIPFKLAEEFTKQYPNVTWDISQDQFANLINSTPLVLASDNAPDLLRLPTMVSFAKDGLLLNLDPYATAFGWNDWPVPQLNQNRIDADGVRGSGTLYAMGLNYSLTGVFYNKTLATQIGMTEPPKTVAEFEDLLAKAKAAGLQPIMIWGSAKSGMGLAFPLQNLMAPSTTGSSRKRARRLIRQRTSSLPSIWNSGSRTATSRLTSTRLSTLMQPPASAKERVCLPSMVTGKMLDTTRTCPEMLASS
jgi:raffinose/stachyose/melibiose transport system substrate-binding protein